MGRAATAALVLMTGLICLGIGFILGWFTSPQAQEATTGDRVTENATWTEDESRTRLMEEIKAENIEENLRLVSSEPRLAGTSKGKHHAQYIEQTWKEQGLDSAGIDTYHVLLSLPGNISNPSQVQIINQEGQSLYRSPVYETIAGRKDRSIPPYVPYSRSGVIEGDLVYVNYGREEDYELLWSNYSITVRGKIVLARFGPWTSPSTMVVTAVRYGATGLILYPDPFMETAGGEDVYPNTRWLPGSAVRRVSVLQKWGDPLTPGYPATEFAASIPMDAAQKSSLSSIPVHTVGYDTARELFNSMADFTPPVPDVFMWKDWKREGSPNQNLSETAFGYTLRLGGTMKQGRRVKLTVKNRLRKKPIHNVCGVINGAVEPDRYVLVGGHRDAWAQGAVDPGGGVAVLLEITRAFGALKQQGWRPSRTMIFCSWDAEEYGLLGSTEFVEDNRLLLEKAVAYINLDIAVMGTDVLEAMSSPLLHNLIFDTLKQIPHPSAPTVYEAWQGYLFNTTEYFPSIGRLQPISDFTPFYFSSGVPSVNIFYNNDDNLGYPAYHTGCDTYDYVKKFIDPSFQYHQVIGRVLAELARKLAESALIPFEVEDYAHYITNSMDIFMNSRLYLENFKWFDSVEGKRLLEQLENSVDSFYIAAESFHQELESIRSSNNPLIIRSYNDKLMTLERSFIDKNWEREDPIYHHVLFSPVEQGCHWFFAGPGINDALCHPTVTPYIEEDTLPEEAYHIVQREFAVLCQALDSTTKMLLI